MHWVDWAITVIPLILVLWIGLKSQTYVRGVADFLSAGRVAGRYVVAVAGGEAAIGLVSIVAMFESYYQCGFAVSFWSQVYIPVSIFLALTGYCVYRFRETHAMTMGQFFEIRYSKSFRVFAAVLQSISGVINYAIFPAVSARFLIYYLGLPIQVNILGMKFPVFALVMLVCLSIAVLIITFGGQVTIMVTDCVQGILSYPMYGIIVVAVLYKFSWFNEIAPTLLDRPAGTSMLNPYDVSKLRDFNLFYALVLIVAAIINHMSWSGAQGYKSAAATPHEQKMGGILSTWRSGFSIMMYVLLAAAGYTYLNNIHFSHEAEAARKVLAVKVIDEVCGDNKYAPLRHEIKEYLKTGEISQKLHSRLNRTGEKIEIKSNQDMIKTVTYSAVKTEDKSKAQSFNTIYGQMLVPIAIRQILPVGITGIFCALAIFLMVSTDTTYMHSWGSIIVQDVILPFRKKPFRPHQQLTILRLVITGVAVFAFFFSLFFGQVDYIIMFMMITGAIWLGGAGPCIVLGLYWKRGTTAGAFASLLSGAFLAICGFLGQNFWVDRIYPWLVRMEMLESFRYVVEGISAPFAPYIVWKVTPDKFPINSMEIYFIAMVVSISLYIIISLLTCKKVFNMDRLLHRGKYHKEGEIVEKIPLTIHNFFPRIIGIDSQYTKWDKVLAWSVFVWSLGYCFFAYFLIPVIWNLFYKWPADWWANLFYINNVVVAGIIGIVSTFWFSIGGVWDLNRLFKRLQTKKTDILDDGRVIGHVSADDVDMVEHVNRLDTEETVKPKRNCGE
ncbi:MAG: hypothetical protein PHV59_06540 [Victivallales bacterium]|nr:hypothetical protein [Victivallales bacterium]